MTRHPPRGGEATSLYLGPNEAPPFDLLLPIHSILRGDRLFKKDFPTLACVGGPSGVTSVCDFDQPMASTRPSKA